MRGGERIDCLQLDDEPLRDDQVDSPLTDHFSLVVEPSGNLTGEVQASRSHLDT